jgi:hypothetical protein
MRPSSLLQHFAKPLSKGAAKEFHSGPSQSAINPRSVWWRGRTVDCFARGSRIVGPAQMLKTRASNEFSDRPKVPVMGL